MTADDMEQLRRLALAALEDDGSWFDAAELAKHLQRIDITVTPVVDANLIATLTPKRVIELLDRVEKAEAALALSHENRTKESVHYANLCAEIIESTGYKSGGGVTAIEACAWVRTKAEAAEARVRVLEGALRSVEWGPEPIDSLSPCSYCLRTMVSGHADDCTVRAALTGSATEETHEKA